MCVWIVRAGEVDGLAGQEKKKIEKKEKRKVWREFFFLFLIFFYLLWLMGLRGGICLNHLNGDWLLVTWYLSGGRVHNPLTSEKSDAIKLRITTRRSTKKQVTCIDSIYTIQEEKNKINKWALVVVFVIVVFIVGGVVGVCHCTLFFAFPLRRGHCAIVCIKRCNGCVNWCWG